MCLTFIDRFRSGKCAFEEQVVWIGKFVVHGVNIEELLLSDK